MRVVVTGAAGFIGSHVSELLVEHGHSVTGADAFTRFYARELKESNVAGLRQTHAFDLARRNLLEPGAAAATVRGADAVCHFAGRPGVRGGSPAVFEAGNVRTTEAVMRAAAAEGVGRVVLASSSSVYGRTAGPVGEDARLRPLSQYGRSKQRAEQRAASLARRLGVQLVTLRFFTVYGPRQRPDMAFARFAAAALGGQSMPLLGDGGQTRDFTYVGDAARATLLALERGRPGATYNVSGGRAVRVADAFQLLAQALGSQAELVPMPPDGREPPATAADLSRARAELGYEPLTPVESGIAAQAEYAADAVACAS